LSLQWSRHSDRPWEIQSTKGKLMQERERPFSKEAISHSKAVAKVGLLVLLLLNTFGVRETNGQGLIVLNNRIAGTTFNQTAHVWGPSSTNPHLALIGLGSNDNPAGSTPFGTASGMTLIGATGATAQYGYRTTFAQLIGALGQNQPESALVPLLGVTTFRTGSSLGDISVITATMPGTSATDAPWATVEIVAWDNSSGLYPTWAEASVAWRNAQIAAGHSAPINVANIGGTQNPPQYLTSAGQTLTSFNLYHYCGPLPTIEGQPESQTVAIGQTATLAVTVAPCSAYTTHYQWLFNRTNLLGETNGFITISSAQLTNAGEYFVMLTNTSGSVTSSVAILQVLPPGAPSIRVNDQLAVGTLTATGFAQVAISGGFTNGFIFYTIDGSIPTTSSPFYAGPIIVTNSAVIQAMSLSADFLETALAPAVTVQIIPLFSLQTTVSGNGIINANPAAGPYLSNSVVVLTAIPAAGYSFDHWAGDLSGSQNPANLVMNGPRSVQAVFVQTAYPLTATTAGGGTVSVNGLVTLPGTLFPIGSVVSIAAVASNGWSFLRWQGDAGGTNNPVNVTMNQTNTVQGVFGTVVSSNVAGSGIIVFSQPNPVPYSTPLLATAVGGPGYYFRLWSGAASGTSNPTVVVITNATPTVGALFSPVPEGKCTLNLVANGMGIVSVNPEKPYYDLGETVVLTATATNAAATFVGWSQDAIGTANPLSLLLNTNKVVRADFGAAPTVTVSPETQFVLSGSNGVLHANAVGLPPLTYQWLHGSGPIDGATNGTYVITNAQAADTGSYSVVVTNLYGSATSAVATVTVVFPPEITQQPLSRTVAAGTVVNLGVTASGTAPLSYQWFKGSGPIMGATNSNYSLGTVQVTDAGSYSVIVTNLYGAVTSAPATVTVYVPVSITMQPASQVVPARSTVSFSVAANGYPAPAYQWKFGGLDMPGATSSTLTITNVLLPDMGEYSVLVGNGYSSQLSDTATLSMSPSVTSPYVGATAIWGRSATLSVGAIGSGELSYQWFKDGVLLPSATGPTLDLPTVQLGDGGMYSVVVSSEFGSVTNTAQLVVNPAGTELGMYAGIKITGAVGYSYEIQYSTDLTQTNSWITLTNITLQQPIELWVDTSVDALTREHRYYRILPGN
jgi:hypothetical protein